MKDDWYTAQPALTPAAAVCLGCAAFRLLDWLKNLNDSEAEAYRLTGTRQVLVVVADEARLPWVEDVHYAAPSPAAPSLWIPTTRCPSQPVDLLARALERRTGRSPLLLWPDPAWIIPLDRLQPVNPILLDRFSRELA